MTLDTNDSIRYLMNEMDPSESIHYERELEKNPDARIELESMRRAADRLQEAPPFSAPKQLLQEVRSLASQKSLYRKRQQLRRKTFQAAAVLTLTLIPSIYFLSEESKRQVSSRVADAELASPWVDQNQHIKLAVTGVNTATNTVANAITATSQNSSNRTVSQAELASRNVTPSFFLTLESEQATHQAAGVLDSIYQESFQKLRPIQQSTQVPAMARDLQLTGSVRN